MDLFFEIQRKKSHIFCDAKETSTVRELKMIIEGIIKVSPECQVLKKDVEGKQWDVLEDEKTLGESGFSNTNAKAQNPAVIALCLKNSDGEWEDVCVDALSQPPPLPDVMRSAQESAPSGSGTDKSEPTIS